MAFRAGIDVSEKEGNLLALSEIEPTFVSLPTLRLVAVTTTQPRLTFLLSGCNHNDS
jgi:hypothetical protein